MTDLYDPGSSDAQNLIRLITSLDLNIEQLTHVLERLKALLAEVSSNDRDP